MANLPEQPRWESGIYQLETTDPVMGGVDGVDNKQAKQLANRTAFLKQEVEKRATTASPTFTGTPTAPTPDKTDNSQKLATTAFVKTLIADLIGGAPQAYDTLAELATAFRNNASLETVLLQKIAEKANVSHSHTMSEITDFELKNISSENLNDLKKTGIYSATNTHFSTAERNYPENSDGALLVVKLNSDSVQVFFSHNTQNIFMRVLYNGGSTWGNWVVVGGVNKADKSQIHFSRPKVKSHGENVDLNLGSRQSILNYFGSDNWSSYGVNQTTFYNTADNHNIVGLPLDIKSPVQLTFSVMGVHSFIECLYLWSKKKFITNVDWNKEELTLNWIEELNSLSFENKKVGNFEIRKFPDGTMIQTGFSTTLETVFPEAFFDEDVKISLTPIMTSPDNDHYTEFGLNRISATAFSVFNWINPFRGLHWIAIGRWK